MLYPAQPGRSAKAASHQPEVIRRFTSKSSVNYIKLAAIRVWTARSSVSDVLGRRRMTERKKAMRRRQIQTGKALVEASLFPSFYERILVSQRERVDGSERAEEFRR